jgi:hypothetical protein
MVCSLVLPVCTDGRHCVGSKMADAEVHPLLCVLQGVFRGFSHSRGRHLRTGTLSVVREKRHEGLLIGRPCFRGLLACCEHSWEGGAEGRERGRMRAANPQGLIMCCLWCWHHVGTSTQYSNGAEGPEGLLPFFDDQWRRHASGHVRCYTCWCP